MPYGQVVADSMQTSSGSILGAGNATAFKNRLIDAGFIINQRGYTSGTSLASGSYGHDRWKGGGSGGTYTFTQGSAGVPISITITAGSIQQVIEGCNMPEGGTYVLSWTGTAQARFNGGTYGSSPLAVTSITAGANTTIEFNTGTLSYPQLEVGSTATSFDYRPYGTELALCQRYCYKIATSGGYSTYATTGMFISTTRVDFPILFPTYMRASPTGTYTAANTYLPSSAGTDFTPSAVASVAGSASAQAITVTFTVSGATAGRAATLTDLSSTASNMLFSAEL
jgi:hypothetical protein